MLNKIIKFSLDNRLLILVAAALLMAAGAYVTNRTEVDVFPDLNAPTVVVMTEAGGMAAEEVEQLVTFPIETAVNGATGVRRVRSSSTTGFSVVWVEFDWDMDIYLARQIVSEKIAMAAEELPENVGNPTLGPQSSILGELLIVGMTADSTSMLDLRTIADWTIRPRLLSVGGVAQVAVLGGDIKEYQVLIHPEKMKYYGVTLGEVMAVTRGMNRNTNGGVIYEYGNEYIVRGVVSTEDVREMARSVIKTVGGAPVTLEDVADVQIGAQQPKLGLASEKGRPAVLVTVTKQPDTGTLELTAKLEEALKDVQKNLPADVRLSTDTFRQARFIESSISNVKSSLFEGAIFVVLVLILFLANVRTTIISLITLPLSILISILTLNWMGMTINTMSLGGLAIAIGSLVDDAIVDVENVWKHIRANKALPAAERLPILKVVFEASKEVRMPILNSTLIIIVSFVPLFFLSGMEGRMLAPLGVAFITALLASTIVALTLTPVLCSYMLDYKVKGDGVPKEAFLAVWLKKYYRIALEWVMRHKISVVSATVALFCVALGLFFTLGHSFLPAFNEGSFTINVSSLPGISLEESDKIGRQAEELLLSIPEIRTVARKTGRAELDEHALGVNVSEIEAPFELGERSHAEVLADVREKLSAISGANIEIGQPISHRIDAMLSGTQASIAIKLFGDDLNRMFQIGNRIRDLVSGVEGIADLNVEQQIERPEIKIIPKREMLAKYGISMPAFSEFITVNMAGETVSQVYEQGKSFNLVVRAAESERGSMESIKDLMIDDAFVGSVVDDIREIVDANIVLPEGYHIEYGGQFESEKAASRILLLTSLMSIIVIFLLLYMQFKSASQSGVVLLNLPLALIGGVFALLLTTGELSIPAIIGFISLFGIATRNGMLLISHYNLLREQGMPLYESIIQGSLDRLNPILMTALSSALALIPLAVKGDLPGNEIQSPMAKVILGGLLTSTFLNGFIVPVMYWWLHRKEIEKSLTEKSGERI